MSAPARALWDPETTYSASVDYLTAYWAEGDSEQFPFTYLLDQIHGKISEGHNEQHRASNGIHWWGAGGLSIGRRDQERFARASGEVADASYGPCTDSCTSLSRLDLAVTSSARRARSGEARRQFQAHRRLPAAAGQPRKSTFVEAEDGGQTFTLGSRTSDVYLRLYDYGVAHAVADAGCRWRWEAELKGRRATQAAALLSSAEVRSLAVSGLVYSLFTDRRVECPQFHRGPAIELAPLIRTDRMRRLDWLRSQVAPSVRRLVEDGQLEEVLKALGLHDCVTPTTNLFEAT